MKLDVANWKEYRIGEFFKIKRGKRIIKDVDYMQERDEDYQFPVVTASATNNSISGYYHSYNCEANSIVSCGEVNGFFSTYQEERCWVLDTNRIFVPIKGTGLKLNKFNALFLITILKKEMFKFSYGRKARPHHIMNTIIKLPSSVNGEPDWEYMENFMKAMWGGSLKTSIPYTNQKILLCDWKDFFISDYFDVKRGKRIVKDVDFSTIKDNDYIFPVITPSKSNNSVAGYYHSYNCPGNTIVCGGEASGFYSTYQEEECWVMDRSRIFIPKEKISNKINKYTSMFLITIFNKEQFKYSYGRSANPNNILNTVIKLPVDKYGNPDWNYMEEFIKRIQFSDLL